MTQDDVLAANEAFYRAFNEKSADAMAAVWSRSDAVTCIHPGWNLLSGRDEVLESWRRILNNPEQPRVVIGGGTVTIEGQMALVACREFVGGTPLVVTNVFVLEDGAWRILHHHSGPVFAG